MRQHILAAIATASTMLGAGGASAAVVTFQNGPDGGGDDRFTVTCSVACDGWLFDAETLSGIGIGGLIDYLDNNYAAGTGEAWEQNLLAGISGDATGTFTKTEPAINPFTSSAEWELFKIGQTPNVGVLRNLAGGSQEYTFDQVATGSGLSHTASYDTGGDTPVVPLPGAALLLLGGLGVLGAIRRRKG